MFTEAQIYDGILKANAAGDTEGATILGQMIKDGRFDNTKKPAPTPPPADSDPSFIDDIGNAWDNRTDEIIESAQDFKTGEIGFGVGTVQTAGQIAGLAGDVIGEGIVHTFQNIGDGLEYAFPEQYEGAADSLKEATAWALSSDAGIAASEAIGKGYASYSKWKKDNPQDAKTFESVVNVALIFSPVKTKIKGSPVPSFGRKKHFGAGLTAKGQAQAKLNKTEKIQDMLFPDKLDSDMVRRTEQVGWNKRTRVLPNASEKEMIENVSKVKGIKYSKGDQYNLNTIDKANIALAKKLRADLDAIGGDVLISHGGVNKQIDDAIAKLLGDNTSVTGDPELMKFLTGYIRSAKKIISEHPQTPAGVLSARQAFDAKLLADGRDLAFNSGRESAKKTAVNTLRRTINDAVHNAVPDKGVRKSLAEQSSLWRAADMLEPKAIAGANNALGRTWQNLSRFLEMKMGANRAFAVVGGISAVSASYAIMPFVGAGASLLGAGVLIKNGVNSPATKMALGKILTLIDKGLKKTTNGDMIKQLRADRIIVQDLFELPVQKEETNKEK